MSVIAKISNSIRYYFLHSVVWLQVLLFCAKFWFKTIFSQSNCPSSAAITTI